jgi:quercetin dioxygenase-like cupin family protein
VAIVIDPRDREPLPGPFQVRVVIRGSDTGGVLAAIEEVLPAKAFIRPHTHSNDVWINVLEGEVGVLVADEVTHAASGQWALKPRDVPHAMWNASPSPARILEILTPAGSEQWFEELARLDPADAGAFDESCRRYGIAFHRSSPWIAELERRFGL